MRPNYNFDYFHFGGAFLAIKTNPTKPNLPLQATECHLSGITAVNKRWSSGSVHLLERFLLRPLELQVEEARRGGSVGVSLYERGETDLCINAEMCRLKYAVAIG